MTAPPNSNLSVIHDKKVVQPYLGSVENGSLMEMCDKDYQVFYYVEEHPHHLCYSNFTVHVVVCAAGESVAGEYYIVWDQENITKGSRVNIIINQPPTLPPDTGIFI